MAASAYRAPTVHRLPPNAIPESSPSPYSLMPDINGVSETFTHAGLPVGARAVGAAAATNSHPSLRPPAHSLSPYRPSCLVARRLPHLQLRQPQYASQLGRLQCDFRPSATSSMLKFAPFELCLGAVYLLPSRINCTYRLQVVGMGTRRTRRCPATICCEWTDARPPGDVTVPLPRMYATSLFSFFLITHSWCPFIRRQHGLQELLTHHSRVASVGTGLVTLVSIFCISLSGAHGGWGCISTSQN